MPGRKSKSIRKSNKNKKRITRRKVRSVKRCKSCGRLIGGAVPQTGEVTFTIKKKFSEKAISLTIGNHYKLLELIRIEKVTDNQLTLRKVWSS